MKCSCGKEVGIRIWCEDCEAKHIKELDDIRNRLKMATEKFKKAKSFLISLIQDFWMLYNLELDLPMIFPGIDGDIDIEWKNKKFQLLISIPEKDDNLAGLYGSDYAEDEIELDFDSTKKNLRLLSWLKRNYDLLKGNIGYLKREQKEE